MNSTERISTAALLGSIEALDATINENYRALVNGDGPILDFEHPRWYEERRKGDRLIVKAISDACARFEGEQDPVYRRVSLHGLCNIIDICSDHLRLVINTHGGGKF